MGQRDRSAAGNLLGKERNDRAGRSQNIAEPNHGKACGAGAGCEILHDHFGKAFGGAHHADGAHGLVGGDKDEALDARVPCRLCHGAGADDIVAHPLDGVGFDHGHVFVGGGVQHDFHLARAHEHVDEGFFADRAQNGGYPHLGCKAAQFALDLEQGMFGMIKQDQVSGIIGDQLAAQL